MKANDPKRRVTVAEHAQWRDYLTPGEIEAADNDLGPLVDHPREQRKEAEVDRLITILDNLQQKGGKPDDH